MRVHVDRWDTSVKSSCVRSVVAYFKSCQAVYLEVEGMSSDLYG